MYLKQEFVFCWRRLWNEQSRFRRLPKGRHRKNTQRCKGGAHQLQDERRGHRRDHTDEEKREGVTILTERCRSAAPVRRHHARNAGHQEVGGIRR